MQHCSRSYKGNILCPRSLGIEEHTISADSTVYRVQSLRVKDIYLLGTLERLNARHSTRETVWIVSGVCKDKVALKIRCYSEALVALPSRVPNVARLAHCNARVAALNCCVERKSALCNLGAILLARRKAQSSHYGNNCIKKTLHNNTITSSYYLHPRCCKRAFQIPSQHLRQTRAQAQQ